MLLNTKQTRLTESALAVIKFLDSHVLPVSEGEIRKNVGGDTDYVSSIIRDLKERGLVIELAISHGLWKLTEYGHREAWIYGH